MIFPLLLTALGGYLIGSSAKQYSRGGKLPSNVKRFVELQDEVNQQIDEKGEADYELTEELNRIGDSLNSYESELAIEEYMKRREPVKMANGGKQTMTDGGELDDEDSLDYNSISDLQSERNRLVRWSNQYGSKGADYKIKQLEERIEYLKSKDYKK